MNSKDIAKNVRKRCLELVFKGKSSHIGGAFSIADVLSVMYNEVLTFDSKNASWEERDRVFYSKGHACTALYSVLGEVGFFTDEELNTFSNNKSFFTTHVNHKVPGVELSTGSLGHALSVSCGVALAGKLKKKEWKVYTIVSDGELNEGSNWEAILFAPHHQLANLTLIVDYNKIQSFGNTNEVLNLEPLADKFKAFNWEVVEVDGHNLIEIKNAFDFKCDKPKVIIAHTIKGKGVDFMEEQLAWHYKSPNQEQFEAALEQIEKM